MDNIKLGEVASYSNERIAIEDVELNNFISIDNILPNKVGIKKAIALPLVSGNIPKFVKQNILIGNIRPYLKKIWFADRDGGCSADVLTLVVKKNHYPSFIYYSLLRDEFFNHMMRGSKGTKMPRGDKSQIMDFLISNFDFITQQKIASILSSLDKKIELNNKINQKLEAMAKTLYDYWFVQFDFPDEHGKPYKSSGGKMVYSEELKREVPEGWEVKKLGEISKVVAGGDKPKEFSEKETKDFKIPVFSNGIQNNGLYGFTNKAKILQKSITISARGTIGYCVLRNKPFVPIIRLLSVTPNVEGDSFFFYFSIKNLVFENSGSVQKQLTVPQISTLKIILSSRSLLEKFQKFTIPIIENIENLKEENQKLTQQRDWLLPMLMNGQVGCDCHHTK